MSSLTFLVLGNAQTCCSGGVPVSNHIGFQSAQSKILQLSFSTDFNLLNTLYNESHKLDDRFRKRTTQSYIFRGAYSFSSKLSGELLIPLIRQTRTIYSGAGDISDFDSSQGLGDPVVLIMYHLVKSKVTWRVGAGGQFPVGSYTETNDRGLFLVEDLQPGSGSVDMILMNSLEFSPDFRPSVLLYLNTILQVNGENANSRGGIHAYKFGNDFQLIAGIVDQFFLFNQPVNFGMKARYRSANQDQINENLVPGTGGQWFFAGAHIGIPFIARTMLNFNIELPITTKVVDTQLSPDLIFNISVYKKLDLSRKNISEIPNLNI